jgi:hypothetical protein
MSRTVVVYGKVVIKVESESNLLDAEGICPPHHWVIEGPGVGTRWLCQRCGARRRSTINGDVITDEPNKQSGQATGDSQRDQSQ